MAEKRIIVVSEVAPRLKKFTTEAAREFLREYFSYQNRVEEELEAIALMKVLVDPHNMDALRLCFVSDGWCRLFVRRPTNEGLARARRRASLQTPMTPAVLSVSFDKEAELSPLVEQDKKAGVKFESVGGETKADERKEGESQGSALRKEAALRAAAEGAVEDLEDPLLQEEEDESDLPLVVPLSNAHVELMLVQALGPQSVDEVVNLLKKIKMVKDPHNTSIVVAVDYVRRWKEEARWCRHFLPDPVTMMKYFVEGIYPRKLAESLKNQRCKSMDECMTSFIVKYRTYSAAKRTVDCYDDGETPQKED